MLGVRSDIHRLGEEADMRPAASVHGGLRRIYNNPAETTIQQDRPVGARRNISKSEQQLCRVRDSG